MNAFMEAVLTVAREEPSALARARLQRQLTPEEAARRAGLTPDEVGWLEEGRLYRFRSSERATVALLLYTTSLGIDRREARRLAGLPVAPATSNPRGRLAVAGGVAAVALAIVLAVVVPPRLGDDTAPSQATAAGLPPPWRISVDVLNGGGDITLHAPSRRPDRLVRVPGQAGQPCGPIRLPRDLGLLPSGRREDRATLGEPARRHRASAAGGQEPPSAGRHRRPAESAELERRPERTEPLLELK